MTILITGAAGFIGNNFCHKLAKNKKLNLIGIDSLNNYYAVKIKRHRIKRLLKNNNIKFYQINIKDKKKLKNLFKKYKFDEVYNFAAQAGVRYSEVNPTAYIDSNITGFINLIKLSKDFKVKKFFYASSSSVYGDLNNFPLKESEKLNPKNFYGMTKKLNEDIARNFFENYKFKSVGLRFFTVFGEWGRPDMFMFKYLTAAYYKKKFYLNNYGNHVRDFTYIDDATNILLKLRNKSIKKNDIYNISSNNPIGLKQILSFFQKISPKTQIVKREFQKSDVYKTHGSNKVVIEKTKYKKFENVKEALKKTHDWYFKNKKYYK